MGSRETFEGQAFDVGWIRQRHIPSEAEFMMMLRKKTGWYSGRGPCTAGAIIADADANMRSTIGCFGEEMAVAFQIRDDLLNLTSSEQDADVAPGVTSGAYGKERGGAARHPAPCMRALFLDACAHEHCHGRLAELLKFTSANDVACARPDASTHLC